MRSIFQHNVKSKMQKGSLFIAYCLLLIAANGVR